MNFPKNVIVYEKYLLFSKRMVFFAKPGETPPSTPQAQGASVEVKPPEGTSIEQMNVPQLEAQLEVDQSKTQQLAELLLQKLAADTTLLERYRQMAQPPTAPNAPAQTPSGTPPKLETKSTTESIADSAVSFFQDISSSLSAKKLSPEEKAIEHKQRIIARIEALVASKKINIPTESIDLVKKDIQSQYAEIARTAPHWTKENWMVTGAVIGVVGLTFLYQWHKSGSFLEGVTGTAGALFMPGLVVAGGGFAAYALKTGFPGTTVGNFAEKVWNGFYRHIPWITRMNQREAKEGQGTMRRVETEEVVKYNRLEDLLKAYRRPNNLTLREGGESFRTRQDMAKEIQILIGTLKNSTNPKLKEFMGKLTLRSDPTPKEIDDVLLALTQFNLEQVYEGKVPPSLIKVLEVKQGLLGRIDPKNNDIPRDAVGIPEEAFRSAVQDKNRKAIDQIRGVKDRKNGYIRRFGIMVSQLLDGKEKRQEEVDRLQQQVQKQRTEQQTDPEGLNQRLLQLTSTVSNINRLAGEYQQALSAGTGDEMYDAMVKRMQELEGKVLAKQDMDAKGQPKLDQGRWEQLDDLSDHWLLIESLNDAGTKIPEGQLTDPFSMENASQLATVAMAGYLLISAGVVFTGVKALKIGSGIASFVYDMSRGATDLEDLTESYKSSIQKGSRSIYAGPLVLCTASLALATWNFKKAWDQVNVVLNGPQGTAIFQRLGAAGVNSLAAVAEIGVFFNAASDVKEMIQIRRTNQKYEVKGSARSTLKNVILLGIIETGRWAGVEALEQWATENEVTSLKIDQLDDAQLIGLFSVYAPAASSTAYRKISSLIRGQETLDAKRQMRVRILTEIAKRAGLPDQIISQNFLAYYARYENGRDSYEFSPPQDQEILTYALIYGQMVNMDPEFKKNNPPSSFPENHELMKGKLNDLRLQMQTVVLKNKRDNMGSVDVMVDPEVRFLVQSFGDNYQQIMTFYQLCLKAQESATPEQKSKLDSYAKYAEFYIHNFLGGYRGPVSLPKETAFTYQTVEKFINGQKNLENPQNNVLLNYYAESLLKRADNIDSQKGSELKAELIRQGVSADKAKAFADEYFKNTVYKKGPHDGLVHRNRGALHEVFLAGQWKTAGREGDNNEWSNAHRGYQTFSRTVDGLKYLYLADFGVFVTEPPPLPAEKKYFFGVYENGRYLPPQYNINTLSTFTVVDIPQAVYEGLPNILIKRPS